MHLFWLILALFCNQAHATPPVAVPDLHQQVTDITGTLNQAQINALTQQTQQLAPAQVAILVVPTTGEETIEQYATRVFDKWKLGNKARSDGVLLLVAWQDRAVRIEVGYGLEGTLTDAQSGKIIRTAIIPAFRKNYLALGLQLGVSQIGKLLADSQPGQGKQSIINSDALTGMAPGTQAQGDSTPPALNAQPAPLKEPHQFRYTFPEETYPATRAPLVRQTPSPSHSDIRSEPLFQYAANLLILLPFFLFRRNPVLLRYLKRVVMIAVTVCLWLLTFSPEIISAQAIFFFLLTALALLYWRARKARRGGGNRSDASSSYSSDDSYSYSSDSSSSYSSDSFSGDGGSSGGGGASDRW